jgi:hypothetical protein
MAGRKIDNRTDLDCSVPRIVEAEKNIKKSPMSATVWRLLISPLPILQLPAIYSLLN